MRVVQPKPTGRLIDFFFGLKINQIFFRIHKNKTFTTKTRMQNKVMLLATKIEMN